jgi:hypothetical protein
MPAIKTRISLAARPESSIRSSPQRLPSAVGEVRPSLSTRNPSGVKFDPSSWNACDPFSPPGSSSCGAVSPGKLDSISFYLSVVAPFGGAIDNSIDIQSVAFVYNAEQ